MITLIPRDYQNDAVHKLGDAEARQRKIVLVGTGGGKSVIALILATLWFRRSAFTHIVFTTPRAQLRRQLTSYQGRTFRLPDDSPFSTSVDEAFPEIVECSSGEELNDYYSRPKGADGRSRIAVATAQVVLSTWGHLNQKASKGEVSLSKVLFIPDEGHHVHDMDDYEESPGEDFSIEDARIANKLSQLIRFCLAKGSHILKLTASAHRGDGRAVYDDRYTVYSMTLMQLMIRGDAPTQLISVVRTIDGPARDDSHALRVPLDPQKTAAAVFEEFEKDGCPPSLVRLKPGDPRKNVAMFDSLMERFKGHFPVNGYGKAGEAALNTVLNEEAADLKAARENGSQVPYTNLKRALFGVHRLTEGVDSPARCCGYMIGIPQSFNVIAQFIGRLLRYRKDGENRPLYEGYPSQWLQTSKISFFIANVEGVDARHCETLLKTCLYLDSFTNVELLRKLFSVDDGILNPKPHGGGGGEDNRLLLAQALASMYPENPCDTSEGIRPVDLITRFRKFWHNNQGDLSEPLSLKRVPALAQQYARDFHNLEVSLPVLKVALVWVSDKEAIDIEKYSKMAKDLVQSGVAADVALQQVLESVFDEFSEATRFAENTQLLNGEIIDTFADKIVRIAENRVRTQPQDHDEIIRRLQAFRDQHSRWPDVSRDGDIDPNHVGWSFFEYDRMLRVGDGVVRVSGGVAALLCERLPWSWKDVEEDLFDYQNVSRASASDYVDRHGEGSRSQNLRALYPNNLILSFYPMAGRMYHWIPEVVTLLTPEEAEELGRAVRTKTRAQQEVRPIFERGGIEEVRHRLMANSFRETRAA